MPNVERIEIESDERGFELHLTVDEDPVVDENGRFVIRIQDVCETLYDQARSRIGPYLRERDEARVTMPHYTMPDDLAAYDVSDPKHPDFHSVHADIWDNRDKTAGL